MLNKDRVTNLKPYGRNSGGSSLTIYTRCVRKHEGKCQANTDGLFDRGNSNNKIRYCSSLTYKGIEGRNFFLVVF